MNCQTLSNICVNIAQLDSTTNILCNSNHGALVESVFNAPVRLSTQSKAERELKFLEVETSVKSNFNQKFSALSQRRCRKEPVLEFEDECVAEEE